MYKIKKINTQNLIIFTYEIFKKMLSVNYEIKTTFYRMTRTPQMLYCFRLKMNVFRYGAPGGFLQTSDIKDEI